MVSQLQRLLVLSLIGVTLALGWHFIQGPEPAGWCWLLLLLPLMPQAPVLAIEFVLLFWLGRDSTEPRPGAGSLFRAWLAEVCYGWRVFGWRQPFRADCWPDVSGLPGRRGVVLLHGYFCNRGLWNPWLQRLSALGVPCLAPTLVPAFGGIDEHAQTIEGAVRQLHRQTGCEPVIVAHSMGGLAVRAWLSGYAGKAGEQAPVHAVVTVGTPHSGTWLARFALSGNARQMRLGSDWLVALAARERHEDQLHRASGLTGTRYICFYSNADNIVFPASVGRLIGAENRHLPAVAHLQMLFQREVWATVQALLAEPARSTEASGR